MCGIVALIRLTDGVAVTTASVSRATNIVRHRGPDDEGYLLWRRGDEPKAFAGAETSPAARDAHRLKELPPSAPWDVAFGHRRLSIVELSARGHQPMVHRTTGLAVAFNGEIYNHPELRVELEGLGHRFESQSDTEVLLTAWAQWGPDAIDRFNGMFAFVLLDPRNGGSVHAVRDRFGVKPLYWARVGGVLAFSSEVKQLRCLPGFSPKLDVASAGDYLAFGHLDHSEHTFDVNVKQLRGGERAVVRFGASSPAMERTRWYTVKPEPFAGTLADAAAQLRDLLADSVRLRLRADVPIGSCLSGGLDSSAIVCLTHRLLEAQGGHSGQVTVTARFADRRYDEWEFAQVIIAESRARAMEVWPTVERLQSDLPRLLWYMDEPFGSTSPFSQWCVFNAASRVGLKVMLDGQGSDEQLAGYAGNDAALYAGLLRGGELFRLGAEVMEFRRRHGHLPVAQLISALRSGAPKLDRFLPSRLRAVPKAPAFLRISAPSHLVLPSPRDLNESLLHQTLTTSLPVLLRYEDRNSMAQSIEARVPFLDYRLVNFLAGLPARMKVCNGVTKIVMREGLRGVLPEAVRSRRDKMGFVTPEAAWLTGSAAEWFCARLRLSLDAMSELIDTRAAEVWMADVVAHRVPFSFTFWRLVCCGEWLRMIDSLGAASPPPGEPELRIASRCFVER